MHFKAFNKQPRGFQPFTATSGVSYTIRGCNSTRKGQSLNIFVLSQNMKWRLWYCLFILLFFIIPYSHVLFYLHVQKQRLSNQIKNILGSTKSARGDELSKMNIWPVIQRFRNRSWFLREVQSGGADMNWSSKGQLGGGDSTERKQNDSNLNFWIPRGLMDFIITIYLKTFLWFHENVQRF